MEEVLNIYSSVYVLLFSGMLLAVIIGIQLRKPCDSSYLKQTVSSGKWFCGYAGFEEIERVMYLHLQCGNG